MLNGDLNLNGVEWEPIGSFTAPFTGTFDGNGKTIRGLTINSENSVGLFGSISGNAEIHNLRMTDVDVTGDGRVGALVGYMQGGTIEHVYVQGKVGNGGNMGGYTGGIVGRMGTGSELLYSSADINASGFTNVGGLVGANEGSIIESFAIGSVTSNAFYVGGLVGGNYGTISESYSWVDVTGGSNHVGGLIGYNSGTVSESYAAGQINSIAENIGGLVGSNVGTVNNSYYDQDVCGLSDTDKGTPLTTEEMKQEDSFAGWNFTGVWDIREGSGYPTLQWE